MRGLSGERLEKELLRLQALSAIEEACRQEGYLFAAGIDEAGRGPLCGPVVAAACVLPPEARLLYLKDSKKLSEQRREQLFGEIREQALGYGIGIVHAPRIDEINILGATFEAMKAALAGCREMLSQKTGLPFPELEKDMLVLVDGNRPIPELSQPQRCLVGGDGCCGAIAAASILAKVTRDRMMEEYGNVFPGYGFEKHKGYGTAAHMEAIRQLGPCPIHRRTFLKNILETGEEG